MLSVGVPKSARRCKKRRRICPASPSHMLPPATAPAFDFFVVLALVLVVVDGRGGGRKRWREGLERRWEGIARSSRQR
jgi:hypothetical protein